MNMERILVIEDETTFRVIVKEALEKAGYSEFQVDEIQDFLTQLMEERS